MQTQMLIGGRLVGGEGPPETVLDAASGAPLATVAAASARQVEAAVAAAEAAFDGWAGTAPRDRGAALLRIADALEREAGAYASLESRNTGKPLAAMLNDEMPGSPTCSAISPVPAASPRGWRPGNTCRDTPA